MKLIHSDLGMQIVFDQGIVPALILESSKVMKWYIEELLSQLKGEDGKFTLSINGKITRIDKAVELIINPFGIDLNSRKIIKGIYDKMGCLAVEGNRYVLTEETLKKVTAYLLDLIMAVDVDLDISPKIDFSSLYKSFGIEVPVSGELVEDLLVYLDLIREYQNTKLTVFVNLSTFLDSAEMDTMIGEILYNEHKVLLVERNKLQKVKGNIKQYVVDKDYCEIY